MLALPDGRRLVYEQSGVPDGQPLLFLHGFTASRLTRHPDASQTTGQRVRLITFDRPGIGGSSFQPRRSLLGLAGDVERLLDELELERVSVLGHSAGGPYALALALAMPDRLDSVGVACGFAPMDRPGATDDMKPDMAKGVRLLGRAPWLARVFVAPLPGQYRRDAARAFERQFGRGLPLADRAALERPELHQLLLDAAVEATAGGARGLATDARLTFTSWGFDPAAVQLPIRLYYGADDVITPPQMGRYLEATLPNGMLTVFPGEGHTLVFTRWAELLGDLTTDRMSARSRRA
jgi:pimeloyl-ACP methyl ester carboxylesterase